jgi:hypothetical protein
VPTVGYRFIVSAEERPARGTMADLLVLIGGPHVVSYIFFPADLVVKEKAFAPSACARSEGVLNVRYPTFRKDCRD